jgi:hypothetical protein
MGQMFRINEQKRNSGSPLSKEREEELEKVRIKLDNISKQLKSCKDCEEWFCLTRDNEYCRNKEPELPCIGECSHAKDWQPHCKCDWDCDGACLTCDLEI